MTHKARDDRTGDGTGGRTARRTDDRTDERIPVTALTGFLGSGKTTLLNGLLRSHALRDAAVVVNEIGEVALDHLLVERVEDEVYLLGAGCICCSLQDDFAGTLGRLIERRRRGEIPAFGHVIVETTGLADPGPVIAVVSQDETVSERYRFGGVAVTVDAVNALRQMAEHTEAARQIACADLAILTKTDLAGAARERTVAAVRRINPEARISEAVQGQLDAGEVLALAGGARSPGGAPPPLPAALEEAGAAALGSGSRPLHGVAGGIATFTLVHEAPLRRQRLLRWLSLLIAARAGSLLRVKGLARLEDEALPVTLHVAHSLAHAPSTLARWPTPRPETRLLFITQDLPEAGIRASFLRHVVGERSPVPAADRAPANATAPQPKPGSEPAPGAVRPQVAEREQRTGPNPAPPSAPTGQAGEAPLCTARSAVGQPALAMLLTARDTLEKAHEGIGFEFLRALHNPWSPAASPLDAWPILELCLSDALTGLARRLLGPDLILWDSHFTAGAGDTLTAGGGAEAWFWPVEPLAGCTVLIALRPQRIRPAAGPELPLGPGDVLCYRPAVRFHASGQHGDPDFFAIRYMSAASRFRRDRRHPAHLAMARTAPLVDYRESALWQAGGSDRGGNDFSRGFAAPVPAWTERT